LRVACGLHASNQESDTSCLFLSRQLCGNGQHVAVALAVAVAHVAPLSTQKHKTKISIMRQKKDAKEQLARIIFVGHGNAVAAVVVVVAVVAAAASTHVATVLFCVVFVAGGFVSAIVASMTFVLAAYRIAAKPIRRRLLLHFQLNSIHSFFSLSLSLFWPSPALSDYALNSK